MSSFDTICPVAVGSDRLKPFTHALALGLYLWVPTEGSSKRLFYCPHATAHPVGDPYGRGWGKASTVGRYETEAGVAKIVPLYRTTVGYVRLRPALKV